MTALNFITSPKAVYIVSDSSFSDAVDMQPAGYITKAYLLPHLEGIIAGTGDPRFIADWFIMANTGFVVRDIIHLGEFTRESLVSLHQQQGDNIAGSFSSTIYHWGYDRQLGQMRSFAYRSTTGFVPEELGCGSALKPGIDLKAHEIRTFPDDYISVMESQKAADEMLPLRQRVGIAGHIIAYWMEASENENGTTVTMSTRKVAELSDYEDGYQRACNKR